MRWGIQFHANANLAGCPDDISATSKPFLARRLWTCTQTEYWTRKNGVPTCTDNRLIEVIFYAEGAQGNVDPDFFQFSEN